MNLKSVKMNSIATILCCLSSLICFVNCINILNEQQQVQSPNSISHHQDHKDPHLPPILLPVTAPNHPPRQQQQQHFNQQSDQDLDNNINHLGGPMALPVLQQAHQAQQHRPAKSPINRQEHQVSNNNQQFNNPLHHNVHQQHQFNLHNLAHTQQTQQQKKGNSNWQSQSLNKLTKYLNPGQLRLIEQNPGSLMAVARALKMATVECHYQMRNEPWDCPIHGFSTRPTDMFGMLMSRSFKETSFIQSLLSSALAHSITRACTESTISTCQRKQSLHNKSWFIENTEFGINFAREFMELAYDKTATSINSNTNTDLLTPQVAASAGSNNNNNIDHQQHQQHQFQTATGGGHEQQPISREKRLRHLINKHNDEVGRLTILDGMKRECKCHGLSGACTLQTCWTRLPPFREVANRLHDSLDKALRVTKEIYIPLTSNNLGPSRYKSLTSTTIKKSNKKRSSSPQPLSSSIEGFGRSTLAPTLESSINHFGGAIRGASGGSGGANGGRLQTFHDTMNNAAANIGGSHIDNPASNGMDGQSLTEFVGSNNNPAAQSISMMNTQSSNTTVVKKRPVARSIGITASAIVPGKFDLLYAEESPDFCMPSESYNIKGTMGRICSENENAINSCKRLCCDRGFRTEIREEKYKCGCKFKFCCELECNTCTRRKKIHKCL